MPILSIIVAMDRNHLIGCGNRLPWRLPADLRHFRATTMSKPVVMGRRTWESLERPLPGRANIVITRNVSYQAEGALIVHSLDAALTGTDAGEIMIIGGASLYAQALPAADRLYLTRIDDSFDGDAWFPEFAEPVWSLTAAEAHAPDEKNPHAYCFETYDRKS